MMLLMIGVIISLLLGILMILIGRWVHRNPTNVLPASIFNPNSPLPGSVVRVGGTLIVFAGVCAVLLGSTVRFITDSMFSTLLGFVAIPVGIFLTWKLLPQIPGTPASPRRSKRVLLIVAGTVFGLAAFVGAVLTLVFALLGNSDVSKLAIQRTEANPECVQRLGIPMKKGLFVSGTINVSGPSGHAELEIPVSGSKGKGTVYAIASKKAGRWEFQTLEVAFEGSQQRVDLLEKPNTGKP